MLVRFYEGNADEIPYGSYEKIIKQYGGDIEKLSQIIC